MQSNFSYFKETVLRETLTVNDTGNCAIRAFYDGLGVESYLIIRTENGITQSFQFGPVIPDIDENNAVSAVLDEYTSSYSKFKYSDKVVSKKISTFLNIPVSKKFYPTFAEEVPVEDAFSEYKSLKDIYLTQE